MQVFFSLDQFSMGIYKYKDPSQRPGGRRQQVTACEVSDHIVSSWQTSIQLLVTHCLAHNHDAVSGEAAALIWVTSSTILAFFFKPPTRLLADTPVVISSNHSGEHLHGPAADIPTTMSSALAQIRPSHHGGETSVAVRRPARPRAGAVSTRGPPAARL